MQKRKKKEIFLICLFLCSSPTYAPDEKHSHDVKLCHTLEWHNPHTLSFCWELGLCRSYFAFCVCAHEMKTTWCDPALYFVSTIIFVQGSPHGKVWEKPVFASFWR